MLGIRLWGRGEVEREAESLHIIGIWRSLEDSFLFCQDCFARVEEVGGQSFLTAALFFFTGQEASASEMDD